jgi:hypothetical protein
VNVTFHLGEPYWRAVGCREVQAELDVPATVAEALAALVRAYPALAPDLGSAEGGPAVFVNDVAAEPGQPVPGGARLHLVWPASGG